MLTEAIGTVVAVFMEHPILGLFMVIALEVPRYSIAIFAYGITRFGHKHKPLRTTPTISAILPVRNGARELHLAVDSLLNQSCPIDEIIIVDDGSAADQRDQLIALAKQSEKIRLLRHKQRAGKSAAINHAAYLASGELLLVLDHDTWLHPQACERLSKPFSDPKVATASGNILVSNRERNPLTSLQSLEYLLSLTIGRGFLTYIGAISCCSGAFSMFRASAFRAIGGMNVGPGEDLEITLRFRQAGYLVHFIDHALAQTTVPSTVVALLKQRFRWDGDAVAIRLFMYRELSLPERRSSVGDVLQRLDYLLMELLPTLIFPFYLMLLWVDYGPNMIDILIAVYLILFWLYCLNLVLAIIITRRVISLMDLLVLPIMPIYQGFLMRLVRFVAIGAEILWARSQTSPFVPSRIRKALYGKTK